MNVIDDIREKVKDATRSAVKISNDLIETTKINLAIKSEEEKINALMLEIGKNIYSLYSSGMPVAEEVADKCEDVLDAQANIEGMKEDILRIRNIRICDNCRAEIDRDDNFCPKCGEKVQKQEESDTCKDCEDAQEANEAAGDSDYAEAAENQENAEYENPASDAGEGGDVEDPNVGDTIEVDEKKDSK